MKLSGSYKGKRKRVSPPAFVQIECPGCGWKGSPNVINEAEAEYVLHLENIHHGILDCAFCDPSTVSCGLRFLPSFETLAAHVKHFHPEIIARESAKGMPVEDGAIPAKAFR